MRNKIIILLLSGIPLIAYFLTALIGLYLSLVYCKVEIDDLSNKLFEKQIMYTKLIQQSVSWQLSSDLQKYPLYIRLISNYYAKILNGEVIFNLNHKSSIVQIEMLYSNQEDPELIRLFKKSSILVNNWYHKNYSRVDELSQEGQALIFNATRLTPLLRTIELERDLNSKQNSRFLQYNLAFIGYQLDGMMFSNTYNNTYQQSPNPQCGPGKFSTYDPRCRGWYKQAINTFSIHFQKPILSFTEQQSYLAQTICQRMRRYNSTTNNEEMHHVFCFNVKLSALINYFENYSKFIKQTYVIDPISQVVVFDSSNRINGKESQTLSTLELNSLESKEEATKFNETLLNQFKQSIQIDRLDQSQINNITQTQILNPYIRNGTQHYLLFNPVYVFDKLSQLEGDYSYYQQDQELNFTQPLAQSQQEKGNQSKIKRNLQNKQKQQINQYIQKASQKWQAQLAYIQINIITDEELRDKSKQLNDFFNRFFIGVCSFFVLFIVVSVIITVYYSLKIKETLLSPIQQLIDVLNKIHQEKDLNQIYCLIDSDYYNIEDIFNSKETRRLYESLNEVFKIMKFSQENFYKENLTKTLLHLNDYLSFFRKFENNYAIGIANNNIGCILLSQGHFYQAIEHFSQSIMYARYEIHQFCMKNALNITSQILLSYCLDDSYNFQKNSQNKQATSFSVNTSNRVNINQISQSIGRFSQYRNQIFSELDQDRDQMTIQNLISVDNKFTSFENKFKNGSFFAKGKLFYTQRKYQNINENQNNQFYKQQIELISTLYYRKKNYIITLMAFQDQMDEQIRNNKLKNSIVYHNFWSEIKHLLKELLLIASELPIWESQQIEILLNISKCQFKINKVSKYHSLIQLCEDLIQKSANSMHLDKQDFNHHLKDYNYHPILSQDEYLKKSYSPLLQKLNANIDFVSNNQLSLNHQINQSQNITPKNYEKKGEYSTHLNNSKKNINNSVLIQSVNFQEKENIFKLNDTFKQKLQNKVKNSFNSFLKVKQDPTFQNFDLENKNQISPQNQIQPRITLHSSPTKQRISSYQLSKKSTKSSLQSNVKTDEKLRKKIREINRDMVKTQKLEQEIQIKEEDEEQSKEECKIEFDFMFSKNAIELLKDITKSEFYIHNKQYLNACEVLTSILENNKYILSHLPFIITEQLSDIFQNKQIYSKELQSFSNQFNKQLKFSITVIFADQRQDYKQQDQYQQNQDVQLQANSNNEQSQIIRQEQETVDRSLIQIYLLRSLTAQLLTQNDDSLSILKATCSRIDKKIYITQIMEQLHIKQIELVFQKIIERIVESNLNQIIFRDQSINKNIPTQTELSVDSLSVSQLDEYDEYQLKDISPNQSHTVYRQQQEQKLKYLQQYKMNFKSPFQRFSNSNKNNEVIINNDKRSMNSILDLQNQSEKIVYQQTDYYQEDILIKQQPQIFNYNSKQIVKNKFMISSRKTNQNQFFDQKNNVSSNQKLENSLNLNVTSNQNIQHQPTQQDLHQNEQNSKEFTFSQPGPLQNTSRQINYNSKLKFQQSQGDNTESFFSITSVNSFQNEDENQQKSFNLLRNQQFHFSIRKALDNLIHPTCFQFQMQQNNFINTHSIQASENQIFYQTPKFQLKKYVIYQTDEINIANNNLFKDLCRILIQFKIHLIILSLNRGSNFLEEDSDQTFLKYNITILYSVDKLIQYLESQRNKFDQHVYPSFLQQF